MATRKELQDLAVLRLQEAEAASTRYLERSKRF